MDDPAHCVFEYLYRDAGNYKAFGKLLLAGRVDAKQVECVRSQLEAGEYFIAEQVGVPTLYSQLWSETGTAFDPELDHVWHEFAGLRPATQEDLASMDVFAAVADMVQAFARVDVWHEPLSRNWL